MLYIYIYIYDRFLHLYHPGFVAETVVKYLSFAWDDKGLATMQLLVTGICNSFWWTFLMLIFMLTPTEGCLKAKFFLPYLLRALHSYPLQNGWSTFLNGLKFQGLFSFVYSSKEKEFIKSHFLMVPLLENGSIPNMFHCRKIKNNMKLQIC